MKELEIKQENFNKAMELYENKSFYLRFSKVISFINVGGQVLLLLLLIPKTMSFTNHLLSFYLHFF